MKVLYDHQAFSQVYGGVSQTFVQLIRHLPEDINYDISLIESDNVHIRTSGIKPIIPIPKPLNAIRFRGRQRIANFWGKFFPSMTSEGRNKLNSIQMLEIGDYDLFHPTFFDGYFLPHLHGKPFVMTVHDMISELFYKKNDKQTIGKREQVKKAAHIITVSEHTKEDLMNILHVPEDKISVIYHAASSVKISHEVCPISGKFILYVGQRNGYKNFLPMVKSLIPILRKQRDLKIVCTGFDFSQAEKSFFSRQKISEQLLHVYASDAFLRQLYAHAVCFIYPSLYEGFGIPILEAYQCHCPVLLNRKSCFPEIAGDAAIYFILDEHQSNLCDVMENFLTMSNISKKELLERQEKQMNKYSWKRSAEQLAEIYRKVLHEKG